MVNQFHVIYGHGELHLWLAGIHLQMILMSYSALNFQCRERSRNNTTELSATFTRRVETVHVLPSFLSRTSPRIWAVMIMVKRGLRL